MTDRNTISQVVESLFEDWIDKNINVHPLAVENMRILEADALAMLKEQEAREPHYTTLRYLVNGMEVTVRHPECPRCIENGLVLWDAEIEKGQAYCKRCGQAVKWE